MSRSITPIKLLLKVKSPLEKIEQVCGVEFPLQMLTAEWIFSLCEWLPDKVYRVMQLQMFHPKQNDEFFLKLRVSKQAIEKE